MRSSASLPYPDRALLEQGLASSRGQRRAPHAAGHRHGAHYWVVGQTIDYLRATPDLPDEFYDIYIIDLQFRPVGSVLFEQCSPEQAQRADERSQDEGIASRSGDHGSGGSGLPVSPHGLVSAPVVDESNRLLGVITIDDAVDVMHEEAEEDILKLGGVSETDTFRSPVRTLIQRLPWLMINLVTAVVASMVIAQFDEAIAKVVASPC
ncbi:MAG: hypothetical protein R3D03_05715 [Geminicoccaceae bacterium]